MTDQDKIRRELASHGMRKSAGNSWKMVDRPNGWLSYRVTWAPGIVTVSGQLGTATYEVWPSFGTLWGAIDLISQAGHDYLVGKSGAKRVFDRDKTVRAILKSADEAMREWQDFSLWERIVREWGDGGNPRNGAEQMRAAAYMRDSCQITEEGIWRIFEWDSVPVVMEYEYSTYQQYEAVRLWAKRMLDQEPAYHRAWRWWLRELDHVRSVRKRGILFRPEVLDAKVNLNGSRWWMRAQRGDRQYFASVSNLRLFGVNLARLGFFTAGGSSFSNTNDASRFEQCDWRKAVSP